VFGVPPRGHVGVVESCKDVDVEAMAGHGYHRRIGRERGDDPADALRRL
jgi:hypothetical protein